MADLISIEVPAGYRLREWPLGEAGRIVDPTGQALPVLLVGVGPGRPLSGRRCVRYEFLVIGSGWPRGWPFTSPPE